MRFWTILWAVGLVIGCGDKDDSNDFGGTGSDPNTTAATTDGDTDAGTADAGTADAGTSDTGDTGTRGTTEVLDGEALYATHCSGCHGADGGGVQNVGPGLANEFSRHSDEELVDVVLNGDGNMPPIAVSEEEAYAIVEWLRAFFEG